MLNSAFQFPELSAICIRFFHRGWVSLFIISVTLCAFYAQDTIAQSPPPPPSESKEISNPVGPMLSSDLLADLDNPDLAVRREIANQLINDRTIADEMIYYTITQSPDLSPEQHDRLLEIAEKRRLIQPGVIGIWIDNQLGPPGVGVGGIMRDAPSSKVLLPGDIILTLNDFEITGVDPGRELQFAVAASRAGEPLEMKIIRRGKHLTVKTKLADPRELPEFRGNTLSTSRALQWALIHDAIRTPPAVVGLVDELGTPVVTTQESVSFSSSGPSYSDSDTERRRNWQIENDFKSRITNLQYLEDNSRRLARITDSPSLSRAVERRAIELNEKLRTTVTDYESFRQSAMSGSSSAGPSDDSRKQ